MGNGEEFEEAGGRYRLALQDGIGERLVYHTIFKQLATKKRDGVVLCGERICFEE